MPALTTTPRRLQVRLADGREIRCSTRKTHLTDHGDLLIFQGSARDPVIWLAAGAWLEVIDDAATIKESRSAPGR
jgi:hypothetical protein